VFCPLSWCGAIAGLIVGGLIAPTTSARAAGVLTVAMTAGDLPTTTGNPDQGFEGFRFVGWNLYDALINWDLSQGDRASDIKPGLATEWHIDPANHKRWIFTLDVVVRMLGGLWGKGRAPIPLALVPLTTGQVLDVGDFTIGCFPVRRRETDSFGFCFESRAPRHLRPDRLAALGVPDGPVRKDLAEGKPVMLDDGRTVDPEHVLGPAERRKKLVVVGDTETTQGLAEWVRDADLLVIEATFLDRDSLIARDYGHLTAAEAATLAATNNFQLLILTHISGRYGDEEILAVATKRFPNSRVANDFDHIVI